MYIYCKCTSTYAHNASNLSKHISVLLYIFWRDMGNKTLYVHKALCAIGDNILNHIDVSRVKHNEEDHVKFSWYWTSIGLKNYSHSSQD